MLPLVFLNEADLNEDALIIKNMPDFCYF